MEQGTMLMADQDALQEAKGHYRRSIQAADNARDNLHAAIRRAAENGAPQTEIAVVLGEGWPKQRVNRVIRGEA